jgi:serine/threonine protein kinase
MPLEPGTKVGPYQIVAPIGSNDSGVYKASDTRLNRAVAIKLLPPHLSSNAEMRERLERDVRTISSLQHPNICNMVDVTQQDGASYVVTEFLEGETLAQRLQRGPLAIEEVLNVAIATADALDKAHRRGVTHRGLNPSNIVLAENGPKLLDFGLTKFDASPSQPSSASSLPTGTALAAPLTTVHASAAPYIAPEQWRGSDAAARTDIFSFGAILYEMVAGKPAFEGKTPALLIASIETIDPEPLLKVQPLTPPAVDHVVRQCLMKDPKQRLQTAVCPSKKVGPTHVDCCCCGCGSSSSHGAGDL